jgi:hypothetical protein
MVKQLEQFPARARSRVRVPPLPASWVAATRPSVKAKLEHVGRWQSGQGHERGGGGGCGGGSSGNGAAKLRQLTPV